MVFHTNKAQGLPTSRSTLVCEAAVFEDLGVSENRGPYYSTLSSRILVIGTPKMVPLIFGNSHMITPKTN